MQAEITTGGLENIKIYIFRIGKYEQFSLCHHYKIYLENYRTKRMD